MEPVSPEEIREIHKKLDMIIDFFHIGQKPSTRNLQAEIDAKFIQLTMKKKGTKK